MVLITKIPKIPSYSYSGDGVHRKNYQKFGQIHFVKFEFQDSVPAIFCVLNYFYYLHWVLLSWFRLMANSPFYETRKKLTNLVKHYEKKYIFVTSLYGNNKSEMSKESSLQENPSTNWRSQYEFKAIEAKFKDKLVISWKIL